MVTPARIAEIWEQGEQIELELGDLADKVESLADSSKMNCAEDPRGIGQGNSIQDVTSIHFDHARGNPTDKNTYLMSVANDMSIRNLDAPGSIIVMQASEPRPRLVESFLDS
jgi:hypothetical protein